MKKIFLLFKLSYLGSFSGKCLVFEFLQQSTPIQVLFSPHLLLTKIISPCRFELKRSRDYRVECRPQIHWYPWNPDGTCCRNLSLWTWGLIVTQLRPERITNPFWFSWGCPSFKTENAVFWVHFSLIQTQLVGHPGA